MRNEQTRQIADALRSGQYQQGQAMLGQVIRRAPRGPITVLHCCMGVMCELTPGVRRSDVKDALHQYVSEMGKDMDPENVAVSEEEVPVYYDGNHEMPPLRVHEWIGLSTTGLASSSTLYLDCGDEVILRGDYLLGVVSLDIFNDTWFLTFDQIGDLIAYFGLTNEASRG